MHTDLVGQNAALDELNMCQETMMMPNSICRAQRRYLRVYGLNTRLIERLRKSPHYLKILSLNTFGSIPTWRLSERHSKECRMSVYLEKTAANSEKTNGRFLPLIEKFWVSDLEYLLLQK